MTSKCLTKNLDEALSHKKNVGFSACVFDVLFNHFDVCAFGQIGEGARCCPLTDGLAENVKDYASGGAMACLSNVCNFCCVSNYCDCNFKGDLIASVDDSLFYSVIVSDYNFVRHVSDFSRHGRKIDVGVNHACAVRVPCNDFAVRVKPMAGAFAGGAAVERAVGLHAIERCLACDFAFAQA